MSVCSGRSTEAEGLVSSGPSNRHNSTRVACAEKSAKLTPTPVQVAPRGYGSPGHTLTHGRGSQSVPLRDSGFGIWDSERLVIRGPSPKTAPNPKSRIPNPEG